MRQGQKARKAQKARKVTRHPRRARPRPQPWVPIVGAPIPVVLAAAPGGWGELARRCLEREQDLRLVAQAADAERAIAAVNAYRPVVVLLDQGIPRLGVLGLLPELRRARRPPRILTVAREADDALALEVARRGGQGLMPEEALARLLPRAVRCLAAGEAWLSRTQEPRVLEEFWQLTNGNGNRSR